ncbi:STM4015 family protein [Nonomuraea sp. SBT364]|uniref:STM4015 family protein n=1 Tax=Nonomuraea sp. SBT364 TaxID=1580530 RepID=UPI00069E0F3A|nr:STM4015 family protein [Nonomuraea sp. SBT364]
MPNLGYLPEFAGLETIDFLSTEALAVKLLHAGFEAEDGRSQPGSMPSGERYAAAKADPSAFAWRLRLESGGDEECFRDYLERFVSEIDTTVITALIIGDCWNPGPANDWPDQVRDLLIERCAEFPALSALFFGEVVVAETKKISWIAQTDVSPLLDAFPALTEFAVRGADHMTFHGVGTFSLAWNVPRHEALRRLTIQSHRLDPVVVRGVLASELPALEHLELFLGSADHDGARPADLAPLLSGSVFPALKHLGLRNGQNTDELVAALADAPITRRLATLDVSLGTLTDKGARLLDTPSFGHLDRLDLHHHYMSEEMTERIRIRFTDAGVEVDTNDRQQLDEWEDWGDPEDSADEDDWEPVSYFPAITD